MESVTRGLLVYLFLLFIFRISGKRTLSENTNFDLVMLLIISETTQQAMVDNDHSITNGFLLIMTLIGANIAFSLLKQRSSWVEKWLDGTPLIIIENWKLHHDRMKNSRVDEEDVLEAARTLQGLERLDQIKYAIVERNGSITVIPQQSS